MVYDDAEKLYAEVRKDSETLLEDAFHTLFPNTVPLSAFTASKLTRASTLFGVNTTFFSRRDVVAVSLEGPAKTLGGSVVQTSKDGSVGYAVLDCAQGGNISSVSELGPNASTVSGM
jgi:alpha-mannosidase